MSTINNSPSSNIGIRHHTEDNSSKPISTARNTYPSCLLTSLEHVSVATSLSLSKAATKMPKPYSAIARVVKSVLEVVSSLSCLPITTSPLTVDVSWIVTSFAVAIPDADIVVSGSPTVYVQPTSTSGERCERHFCGKCGSHILGNSGMRPGVQYVKATLFDLAPPVMADVFMEDAYGEAD
jgi:hypothetical protein